MLRANAATGNLNILLPMVTSLDEVDEARRLIERAGREVEDDRLRNSQTTYRHHAGSAVNGIYAAASGKAGRFHLCWHQRSDAIHPAVDRNNTRVANIYDSLHPAMLRALAMIAREAEIHGIDLRLCGEMAGDPCAWQSSLGLGIAICL